MNGGLIFFLAAVIIIGAVLFALITISKRGGGLDVDKYRIRWMEIEQSMVKGNEPSYHLAVLNADKLVDQALKDRGTRGQTMGARMKSANKLFTQRDAVWSSHKLRNKIAHESGAKVSYEQARRSLAGFKRALKDLGAI